ncbi:PREDICTED: zinc transporter ZIP5 [Nanorana parkeri]|uniref:zinc transporter ZIP5 n=1 Tax=Nanorana parkeri TaxID=125878 RepID=UPI0008541394|nr:PREDICTED: zinc transporter ZIP5 [Nanorana parkeri]
MMLFHRVLLVLVSSLWIFCSFSACQEKPHLQNVTSSRQEPPKQDLLVRTAEDNVTLLEEAEKEQGYYLQQLFHLYGENNTLTYQGLTLLLKNLGLGKVQVVEIYHAELGHDHVSHLDILDVQENRHKHAHSSLEHLSVFSTPGVKKGTEDDNTKRRNTSTNITTTQHATKTESDHSKPTVPDGKLDGVYPQHREWLHRDILQQLLQLHESENTHQHENCLNVTQLLLNFGLGWVSEITPQQFALLCPALLYQIDSRVCIKHSDQLIHEETHSQQSLLKVLGWGTLAVTVISAPSLLAVAFVPLLRRPLFRYLLRFLVALAVGTLCGDALLHLLPHSQEDHTEPGHHNDSHLMEPVLKGLSVLGGIYVLFLIENLLGLLRQRRRKKRPRVKKPAQDEGCTTVLWELGHPVDPEFCEASGAQADCQQRHDIQLDETGSSRHCHAGHSHSAASGGIAEFVWMVLLGDGIHNFTDGLAIGAAFSAGISGGLSTTIAVFCHELPHELGDFAVLLQAGVPVKRVLCFSLISALLAYLGMLVGVVTSRSSAQVTPWMFAATAGIFLYVALVDMLPQMLHRESSDRCQGMDCILQSAGFLVGCGIMLCIALFQDHMVFLNL